MKRKLFIALTLLLAVAMQAETIVINDQSLEVLSVTQWAAAMQLDEKEDGALHGGEAYAVKGVFYETTALGLEDDGKYSFILTEDGQNHGDTRLVACHMYGPNNQPFYSTTQLSQGDTAIVYGTFGQKSIAIPYVGYEWYSQSLYRT